MALPVPEGYRAYRLRYSQRHSRIRPPEPACRYPGPRLPGSAGCPGCAVGHDLLGDLLQASLVDCIGGGNVIERRIDTRTARVACKVTAVEWIVAVVVEIFDIERAHAVFRQPVERSEAAR